MDFGAHCILGVVVVVAVETKEKVQQIKGVNIMQERHHNRIWILPLLLLVTLLVSTQVAAAESGSITVKLNSGEHASVAGVEVTLWRVGESVVGSYVLLSDYVGSGVKINNLNTAQEQAAAASDLTTFIEKNRLLGIKCVTNSRGEALFSNLSVGLYLLRVTSTVGECIAKPFLVPMPLEKPDGSGWNYEVIAEPKIPIITGKDSVPPPLTPPPSEKEKPLPLPDKKLPQTGQNVIVIWLCSALGFVFVLIGIIGLYRDRKK